LTIEGLAGQRVHLLVRGDGAHLHVVALCTARNAPAVRRVLADAVQNLRALGHLMRCDVREAVPA
jgi:hypothetical protein